MASSTQKKMNVWTGTIRDRKEIIMTALWDLLYLVNDNTVVDVYNNNQELIATYDGKDSIPEELNWSNVNDVFVEDNKLCIEIDYEGT